MIKTCSKCHAEYYWEDNAKQSEFKDTCQWCHEVDRSIREGLIDQAISSARKRAKYRKEKIGKRLTAEEREQLVISCIERGKCEPAIRAAQLRNRRLSEGEIATLMKRLISNADLVGAQMAADVRGDALTVAEVDGLVEASIRSGDLEKAFVASALGASGRAADSLVEAAIREGTIWKVRRATERRGISLGTREGQLLVQVHLDRGNVIEAFEAAKLRGIALSSSERQQLAQAFVDKKWRYCGNKDMEAENTGCIRCMP